MTDRELIEKLHQRDEAVIVAIAEKYGGYCYMIAYNILQNEEDAKECVNDAYLKLWESFSGADIYSLGGYLSKIVRNLALNRYRFNHRSKRGGAEVDSAIVELNEIFAVKDSIEEKLDYDSLVELLNVFLKTLKKRDRTIFLMRYFEMTSIGEIAAIYKLSESGAASVLFKTRQKLRKFLIMEGYDL